MISIAETRFSESVVDRDEKKIVNSNLNIQYSLMLIEASLDYLLMINTEAVKEKNSALGILKKLISISIFNDELSNLLYSKEMLKQLLKDHERLISQFRASFEKYREKEEAGFITSILEKHQSIAKRLRKYF